MTIDHCGHARCNCKPRVEYVHIRGRPVSFTDLRVACEAADLALVPMRDLAAAHEALRIEERLKFEALRELDELRAALRPYEAMTEAMLRYNSTCGHDALREGAKYELDRRKRHA
jgi:hypothetical protein